MHHTGHIHHHSQVELHAEEQLRRIRELENANSKLEGESDILTVHACSLRVVEAETAKAEAAEAKREMESVFAELHDI